MSRHRRGPPRDARAKARGSLDITLDIERLVPGGLGLARDAGGVIFVRGAIPGERVHVIVERQQKGTRHASVLSIVRASPDRVEPDCPLHPRCGGCDLLDLAPRAHADVKRAMVTDALGRIAKIARDDVEKLVRPTDTAGPNDDARRRRARMVVGDDGALTFSERGAHDRVVIDACPALHPDLERQMIASAARGLPPDTVVRLAMDDAGTAGVAIGEREALDHGAELRGEIAPGVAGGPYASDAAMFTQATRFGGLKIVERVLEAVSTALPLFQARERGLGGEGSLLELFAGAGHLTLPLVHAGFAVDAVEGDERCVAFLERNVAQLAAFMGDASTTRVRRAFIDGTLAFEPHDVLVADPPRTGIPDFAAILARSKAGTLAMVSCDVATGARDIGAALRAGFTLRWVQPIDAFPRTSHVETVALLTRADGVRSA